MVESVLDQVPGLGEVRRKVLMRHFGSLRKLRAASIDQIAALPGFGQRTAEAITAALAADAGSAAPAINMTTGEIIEEQAPEPASRQ
jgi:excinuclease ABC subunit C